MSMSYEVDYDLVRMRRQEANNNRVRESTQTFLARYRNTLDQISDEGLAEFVRGEFDHIKDLLDIAERQLWNEPFAARDTSRKIGDLIRGLGRRARDARNTDRYRRHEDSNARRAAERAARLEEMERVREERELAQAAESERRKLEFNAARAARTAFVSRMSAAIKEALADPVAYDIARSRAETLADSCAEKAVAGGHDVSAVEEEFNAELGKIAEYARKEAERWRNAERAEHAVEDAAAKVEASLEAVRRNVTAQSSDRLKNVLEGLLRIKEGLTRGEVGAEQAAAASDKAVDDCVEELVNEDVRRETLIALVGTVQRLGFVIIGEPEFTEDGGVLVLARRPSGEECQFVVRADGGMRYAFENYSGTVCRKDCAQVEAMLREVYGVVVSNERVIWENPDEVGKETFRDGNGITTKGCL